MPDFAIEQDGVVTTVKCFDVKAGWEQWLFVTSDQHHDNPMCRRDIEQKHLNMVKERDALFACFGDTFCAMQGKYDPRKSFDEIRPEDAKANYLDLIVQHAAEFYGPYAKNILLMGMGNHEASILDRHHTNLISNLVHRLNSDYGGQAAVGDYAGWIRFQFESHAARRQSLNLRYHHGGGAAAEVTRGVIRTNRQAAYLADAHIVVNGHNHHGYHVPLRRERLSDMGKQYFDYVHFLRTPGYKDEYGHNGSYHMMKERDPRPLGGAWIRFYYDGSHRSRRINFDVTLDVVN